MATQLSEPASWQEFSHFEVRGDPMAALVHDVSQPLTALHALLDLALLRMPTNENEFTGVLQSALEQVDRAVFLVVCADHMAEVERHPERLAEVNLSEVLDSLVEDIAMLAESRGSQVESELQKGIIVRGWLGPIRSAIMMLLESLVDDAVPSQVIVKLRAEDGTAMLELQGAASPETAPNVRQQDWSARKRRIVLEMLARMGATVSGRKAPGGGNNFTAEFPLADEENEPSL